MPNDTLTTAEQDLVKALSPKASEYSNALQDYALELSKVAPKDARVSAAWRAELLKRIRDRGVEVSDSVWTGGIRWIDQQLEHFVVRYSQGDSAVVRRQMAFDPALLKAIDMMNKGQTQRDLFRLAEASVPTAAPQPGRNQSARRP